MQIHTRGMPLEDVDLKKLADVTHGFVGADLEALAKEAAIRALRRILPEINLEAENIPAEVLNKIIVRMSDFQEALKEVEPSAMREVLVEVPDIKWDDIGGLEGVKEELREIFKEAQENAPSIIFIDEIDSIAPKREEVTGEVEKRVVSQLLSVSSLTRSTQ